MQDIGQIAPDSADRALLGSYLSAGHYAEGVAYCEQAIEADPNAMIYYWYLGLLYLLQEREEEAQAVWMSPMLAVESEAEQHDRALELAAILQMEAQRQATQENYQMAWVLCQYQREFVPLSLEELLWAIAWGIRAESDWWESGLLEQITETLPQFTPWEKSDRLNQIVLQVSEQLLEWNPGDEKTLAFLRSCVTYLSSGNVEPIVIYQWVRLLHQRAGKCYTNSQHTIAAALAQIYVPLAAYDYQTLHNSIDFLKRGDVAARQQSVAVAERCLTLCEDVVSRIVSTQALLAALMGVGGQGQRTQEIFADYKTLLRSVLHPSSDNSSHVAQAEPLVTPQRLLATGGLLFYFEDEPAINRPIRNQIAQIAETELRTIQRETVERYAEHNLERNKSRSLTSQNPKTRLLKIGYLSNSLRQHSVGWLSRWLLMHHDPDRFEVHLYSHAKSNDAIQNTLVKDYGDRFHHMPTNIIEIADQIHADQIDILVELDSLTDLGGCGVVALKPAPIQVHWLGFDASGLPSVDYFIADPYVLPDNAQDYYQETIWRLPQSYIAVNGFEIGTPSRRRDQLDIPDEAIVYLSSQTGLKRNPENVRLQLQILKAVPNSYFLIKSFRADQSLIETFFKEMADAEGVSVDRLRFLPDAPSELGHRANLQLADVVLDTYPYNGATTTLEALWVGLPIVTRVGQQFAARNSYTMLMNTGIHEGIAWNDAEYIEWGIRLGTDAALRQAIACRLWQSRRTAPLWDSQQFTREMEKAYEQMWMGDRVMME